MNFEDESLKIMVSNPFSERIDCESRPGGKGEAGMRREFSN